MFKVITSRQNPLIREIKRISQGKVPNKLIVETPKILEIVVRSKRFRLELILITENFLNSNSGIIGRLKGKRTEIINVREDIIDLVSDTMSPQGIVGVVGFSPWKIQDIDLNNRSTVVICDAISDPGNIGSIIRSCDAFGVKGVFIVNDACNIYSPKVIRASAGSLMNIPVVMCDIEHLGQYLKRHNITTYAAVAHKGETLVETNFGMRSALVFGNEARGISHNTLPLVNHYVTIPTHGGAESLNVASAGAIVLYEIMRQRRKGGL